MDEEFVEESEDQPEEESLDQPDTEDSSEGRELLEDEDQPEEESSEEMIEVDGEEFTLEEIKKGFMRNKDYTRKTQDVSQQKREIEDMKRKLEGLETKRELTPEERQIQDFIHKYGLVTADQLEHRSKKQQAQQADEREFQSWKSEVSADDKIAEIVLTLGRKYTNMSYPEIYNEFVRGISAPKKVVRRRKIGVTSRSSGKKSGGTTYTREKIQELIQKGEYEKHRPKIIAALEKGKKN